MSEGGLCSLASDPIHLSLQEGELLHLLVHQLLHLILVLPLETVLHALQAGELDMEHLRLCYVILN